VVAGLAVATVVVFDAVSIGAAHLSAEDDATQAALAGSDAWQDSQSARAAYDAASGWALEHNEKVPTAGFSVTQHGLVRLELTKRATTLVVRHIEPISHWASVRVEGHARSVA
jgi:hypothetical protein